MRVDWVLLGIGGGMIVLGVTLMRLRQRLVEWHRRGLHCQGMLDWPEMFPRPKPVETIGLIGVGALLDGVGLYFVINALGW
jgi:hypothetical protein